MEIQKIAAQLTKFSLFNGLSGNDIVKLFSQVPFTVKRFEKKALVAFRGESYDRLILVLEGELSAEMVDYQGRVLKIENLKYPAVVASGILFADENNLPVQLCASTAVSLLYIEKKHVLEIFQFSRVVLLNYLAEASNKVVILAKKIRLYQFHTIRQKIASYLLDLYAVQADPVIKIPYTIETLAEIFGVSRPSLSRSLSEIVKEGLISRTKRGYKINDIEKIRGIFKE